MLRSLFAGSLLTFAGCRGETAIHDERGQSRSQKIADTSTTYRCEEKPYFRHTPDSILVAFLDSIGRLPKQLLVKGITDYVDSIQQSFPALHKTFGKTQYNKLRAGIAAGVMSRKDAMALFHDPHLTNEGYDTTNTVKITYYSLYNKHNANSYAVVLDDPNSAGSWSTNIYFFQEKALIAKHDVFHHNDFEFHSFRNECGRVIIYYKYILNRGSEVSHAQYFFYCVDGDKVLPLMNIPSRSSSTQYISPQPEFNSDILSHEPLIRKTDYYWSILSQAHYTHPCDSSGSAEAIEYGTRKIRFRWEDESKKYTSDVGTQKFLAFYMPAYYSTLGSDIKGDPVLLFVNLHHAELWQMLNDPSMRETVLYFLDQCRR